MSTGRWDLSPADDGKGVVVTGALSSKDSMLRFGVRRRLRSVLEGTLAALKTRCLSLAATDDPVSTGERRKILEIRKVDGGLELDLAGESFSLRRTGAGEGP